MLARMHDGADRRWLAEAFGREVAGATVVVRSGMGHLRRPRAWAVLADLVIAAA